MSYNRKSSVLSIEANTKSELINDKLKSEKQENKAERTDFTKLRIIKNLVIISLTFMLIFTAYDGMSMLQSTMNRKNGVGTISQAIAFLAFGLASLLLPKYVIKKIGCRNGILLATSLFWPYQAANFYPEWITFIPSAFLVGVGGSLIWATQCTYFNECAAMYVQLTKECNAQSEDSKKTISWSGTNAHLVYNKEMEDLSNRPDQIDTLRKYNTEQYERSLPKQCVTINTVSKEMVNILNAHHKIKYNTLSENLVNSCTEVCVKHIELPDTTTNKTPEVKSWNNSRDPDPKQTISSTSDLDSITARIFGCHGMVYSISQIWSNLITFYVLNMSTSNETNNTNSLCGAAYCESSNRDFNNDISDVSNDARNLLSVITVALSVMGVIVILLFLDPLNDDKESITFSLDILMATMKHFKKKKQLLLIPLTIFIGMSQGFYTADFTKSYVRCAWSTAHVGLVTISYGVFSGLTSTLSGFLVKYLGRVLIIVSLQVINIGVHVFLLEWEPGVNNNGLLFFLGAGLWGGVVEAYWTQVQSIIGILNRKEEEAAFASYNLWSAFGWCLSFVTSDYLCTYIKLYISMAVSTIGVIGYLIVERDYKLNKF